MSEKKAETKRAKKVETEVRGDFASTNITTLLDAVLWYGGEVQVCRVEDGHSGAGWYAWSSEYPEEGSTFLTASGSVFNELATALAQRAADLTCSVEELERRKP